MTCERTNTNFHPVVGIHRVFKSTQYVEPPFLSQLAVNHFERLLLYYGVKYQEKGFEIDQGLQWLRYISSYRKLKGSFNNLSHTGTKKAKQ